MLIYPLWHASPTLFVDPKCVTIIQLIFDFSYRKWTFLFDLVKLKWTAHVNKWDQKFVNCVDSWLLIAVHNCKLFIVDCYDCWFVDVKYWLSIVNCWSSIEDSWLMIVHCWLLIVCCWLIIVEYCIVLLGDCLIADCILLTVDHWLCNLWWLIVDCYLLVVN